jgi:ribonuclease HI
VSSGEQPADSAGQLKESGRVYRLRIWIDGGSRGNPGPSAVGVLVEDEAGCTVATVSRAIGISTNNVAEYKALLAALDKAQELGAGEVEVISDSELLVRQMLGRYRVKNAGLQPLYVQAKQKAARFGRFTISHTGREHNVKADGLVNSALDEQQRAGL